MTRQATSRTVWRRAERRAWAAILHPRGACIGSQKIFSCVARGRQARAIRIMLSPVLITSGRDRGPMSSCRCSTWPQHGESSSERPYMPPAASCDKYTTSPEDGIDVDKREKLKKARERRGELPSQISSQSGEDVRARPPLLFRRACFFM
jgi:hypothetical protein